VPGFLGALVTPCVGGETQSLDSSFPIFGWKAGNINGHHCHEIYNAKDDSMIVSMGISGTKYNLKWRDYT
jgi:hypothetical protein